MLNILSILSALPLFVLVYPYTPIISFNFGDSEIRIDHLLVFILILLVIRILLRKMLKYVFTFLTLLTLWFAVNTVTGGYGFKEVFQSYHAIILSFDAKLVNSERPFKHQAFKDAFILNQMIVQPDSMMRNYALDLSGKHFNDLKLGGQLREWAQALSIFKEINNSWNYVDDPLNREYYASPSETVNHFYIGSNYKGDCDDHAILMCSMLYNIGVQTRLVRAKSHIYPEMFVGSRKDFEKLVYYIRYYWFEEETKGKKIFYHLDREGNIWINLDYSEPYPGGFYLENDIVGSYIIH